MPQYLVEKAGKRYQVEASDPEAADAAVDEILGVAPAGPSVEAQDETQEMTRPVGAAQRGSLATQQPAQPMTMKQGLSRLGSVALAGAKRAPLALAEGAGDLVLTAAQTPLFNPGGIVNPEIDAYRKRYREDVNAMREETRQDESKPAGTVLASDIIAGLLPLGSANKVTTLGGGIVRAEKLWRAVTPSALEGAAMANLPYDEADPDRTTRTALGIAGPAAFRTVKATGGAVVNVIARKIARRADSETKQLMQEAKEAFTSPVTGDKLGGDNDYTIAQEMGDPRISRFTSASADTTARDTVRKQLDQRLANVQKVANELGGKTGERFRDSRERAAALYRVVDENDAAARTANSAMYGSEMNKLAASPEGKAVRIPLQPMADAVASLQQRFGNLFNLVDPKKEAKLHEVLSNMQSYLKADPNAALNITGLRKMQEGINAGRMYGKAVLSTEDERLNAIRNELTGAIQRSVEQNGQSGPGYAKLRDIAKEYATNSDRQRLMKASVLTKLFGDKFEAGADPEAAFDSFIHSNEEAQQLGVRLLNETSAGQAQLHYMRKRYLDSVLDYSTKDLKSGMVSKLDIEKLYSGLTSDKMLKNPLFSTKEKAWAAAAAKDLRVIANSLPDTTKVGKDITLEDLSINVISRSPEFMTRFVVRAASGLGMEDLLFSQRGRATLSTVANLREAKSVARERAAAYLIGLLAREDQPESKPSTEQPAQ